MRRSLLAAAISIGLLATLAPVPAFSAPASARPAIVWGSCPPLGPGAVRDPRQQCATLAVPLDHRHPRGRQISVAISRIATSTPSLRRGILLSNPGGPGGSGLDMPSGLAATLSPDVLQRYDLIGFDPRGVGHSTPVSCDIPADTPVTLMLPYPAPDGSTTRNIEYARRTAAGCAARSGDLLPHITTANTARDMDTIRAALGEPRLSYFGGSYGTYLGAVYASLFPWRSDRFVLDSAVDPSLAWTDMWRTWNDAIALRLPDFTNWVADRDATYHLGTTAAAVAARYTQLADELDRTPVPVPGGPVIDGNYLREITRSSLYRDSRFPDLAFLWQFFATAPAKAQPARATQAARLLARLTHPGLADPGLADPGTMRPTATAAGPGWAEVPADNRISALYAVTCDDVAAPKDPAFYARRVARDRSRWPATAGMPGNIWPCAFWPSQPVEAPVPVTDRGPRNVLILQQTRDPATSLASALGLRRALGHRASMVTVDAGGHGVYGRGTCADDIMTRFLATGVLPGRDRSCPGPVPGDDPQFVRTGNSSRATWLPPIWPL